MDDLTMAQWGEILRDMAEVARCVHAAEQLTEHQVTAPAAEALLADADQRLERITAALDGMKRRGERGAA